MKTQNHTRIIVGLGFGDEGKGTMVDYLCRQYGSKLVIRYNGGVQAAHNVITDEGVHHTFAQIGSGTFVPGVKTLLSKFMLWNPFILVKEVAELSAKVGENVLERHFIDRRAPVATPIHIATNRIKEWIRGGGRHGSCGLGVGELGADLMYQPDEVVRAGFLADKRRTRDLLRKVQERKLAELNAMGANLDGLPEHLKQWATLLTDTGEVEKIAEAYRTIAKEFNIIHEDAVNMLVRSEDAVFEGAQGMLLDEWHGFHPYTTWSTITPKNAHEILDEAGFDGERETIGLVRAYATRHGAGPFVTEDPKMRNIFQGEHNGQNAWQGTFRVGGFDGVLLRYALECAEGAGKVDTIGVTHLDAFGRGERIPLCEEYRYEDESVRRLVPNFNQDLGYQEKLTNMVMAAEGVTKRKFGKPKQVIEYVESTTGKKVNYLSYGPMPKDKRVR